MGAVVKHMWVLRTVWVAADGGMAAEDGWGRRSCECAGKSSLYCMGHTTSCSSSVLSQEFALLAPACRLSPVEAAGDYDTSASSGFVVLVVCLYCFWASTSVGCPRHVAQAVLCETAETPA